MTARHTATDSHLPVNELENELRETIRRYELLFQATNDVVYEFDIESGRVVWNDALFYHYGYNRTEEVNLVEWWAGHIHPDDAFRTQSEISNWFESDVVSWLLEYRFMKADGTYVDVVDRCVVKRNKKGVPVTIVGSFLDVTRQKQLDKAKDEFISLVSHQLRTPLTAIRLYSDMLMNGMYGVLSEMQQPPVQHIADASVRLINLVGNILDISKIELGHIVSDPIDVDIKQFLLTHTKDITPLLDEKNIELYFEFDDTIKNVAIDTTIFGQILHNLLTNSIRYTKETGKHWIRVSFLRNDEGYVLIVKDNGMGIPLSAKPYIFNRFFRAPNALATEQQGTGLGLYMIKLMSEAAGCKVWFNGKENKGTTFYVQLPPDGMQAG